MPRRSVLIWSAVPAVVLSLSIFLIQLVSATLGHMSWGSFVLAELLILPGVALFAYVAVLLIVTGLLTLEKALRIALHRS